MFCFESTSDLLYLKFPKCIFLEMIAKENPLTVPRSYLRRWQELAQDRPLLIPRTAGNMKQNTDEAEETAG